MWRKFPSDLFINRTVVFDAQVFCLRCLGFGGVVSIGVYMGIAGSKFSGQKVLSFEVLNRADTPFSSITSIHVQVYQSVHLLLERGVRGAEGSSSM